MIKRIKIILVITWMIVIFMFSNQVATESTKLTEDLTNNVIDVVDKDINEEGRNNIIEYIFVPLRKSAHFFVYFILGILIYSLLIEHKFKHKFMLTLILVLLYAITDEFHQTFIPGRSAAIKDVFIDLSGGMVGTSLIILFYKIKNKIKLRNAM